MISYPTDVNKQLLSASTTRRTTNPCDPAELYCTTPFDFVADGAEDDACKAELLCNVEEEEADAAAGTGALDDDGTGVLDGVGAAATARLSMTSVSPEAMPTALNSVDGSALSTFGGNPCRTAPE